MQQKKSRKNNSKELITCYKCNRKNHIKKTCSIFKSKKSCLKTKNMVSHPEFNNIKFNDAKMFNMICTILFLKKNVDNPQGKRTDDEESEDE